MPVLHRALILPAPGRAVASDDIAAAGAAAADGLDAVWVGERAGASAPSRAAALAAVTVGIGLGVGGVPLGARSGDHLEEVLSTLCALAPGRVRLAVEPPTVLAGAVRPAWASRLAEVGPRAARGGVRVSAIVPDVSAALVAAEHVDEIVLRGADTVLTAEVVTALARSDSPTPVHVWLDLAESATASQVVAPVVAERLAVPGVAGHATARMISRRTHPGLSGDAESAYARGAPDEAVTAIPADFLDATCLLVGSRLADRVHAYEQAGAAGIAILPHGDAATRGRAVSAFAAAGGAPRRRDPATGS